jgi:redox-sensing transcriptional repressor
VDRGFPVAGLVDIDPTKVGSVIGGVRVRHLDDLPQVVQSRKVSIGIVATPPASAQDAADRLVAAGITSILNFAPTVLSIPRGVALRKVDLAVELQILSYHEQRRSGAALTIVAGGESGRPASA